MQILEKGFLEQGLTVVSLQARQVGQVFVGESEGLDEVDEIAEAAGDGVAALERAGAEIEVESRLRLELLRLPVAAGHGELVEVGEKTDRLSGDSQTRLWGSHLDNSAGGSSVAIHS